MTKINDDFDYIKINLASPERIKSWAKNPMRRTSKFEEVLSADTVHYRTFKPEPGGLFCERIFGPVNDWECYCGEYVGVRRPVTICEICGVEITDSRIRRHRMGYIKLKTPVAHIWYVRGFPSYLAVVLGISRTLLNEIIYFNTLQVPSFDDEFLILLKESSGSKRLKLGGELLFEILSQIDVRKTAKRCRERYSVLYNNDQAKKLLKRIRILESFIATDSSLTWMLLSVIPVLPPGLRPLVKLDGGRFAASDLNELYRRVIYRSNRLKRFLNIFAPEIIIRNEKRMLQEAVDALIDNDRREKQSVNLNNRPLKSLSEILSGKQGRFRKNLLGKRVDYSGRSVIVVGPELKLNQCGLPYEICCELFQPFIIERLLKLEYASNIKTAKHLISQRDVRIWEMLKIILEGFPIFLNRAPTLHRLGIQAFEPVVVSGRAIKLHPLVCPAFNADFDGDQMAVHIPLSIMAQAESYLLMLSPNNFMSPATGEPIVVPSQDMVLGTYYLTVQNQTKIFRTHQYFSSVEDVIMAYNCTKIKLHSYIWLRFNGKVEDIDSVKLIKKIELADKSIIEIYNNRQIRYDSSNNIIVQYILTTPGRVIFNQLIYSI